MFSSIVSSVKAGASAAKQAASDAYHDAKARPTQMLCAGCDVLLQIPESVWVWTCKNGHTAGANDVKCATCQDEKPKGFEAKMRCGACNSITVIPTTNAEKGIREAANAAKKKVDYLKSRPTEFNCSNCNGKLAVPQGPWACQTCATQNAADVHKCTKCSQSINDQKVMCGVCNKSTKIPAYNLFNEVSAAGRSVGSQLNKAYYDASGKPHVQCPRCKTSCAVVPATDAKADEPSSPPVVQPEGAKAEVQAPAQQLVTCTTCGLQLAYVPPPAKRASQSGPAGADKPVEKPAS